MEIKIYSIIKGGQGYMQVVKLRYTTQSVPNEKKYRVQLLFKIINTQFISNLR